MQVASRSFGSQNYGKGKAQDGRKKNAQNLSQEDRARGGRHSAKSRGKYDYDDDNDYEDENYDSNQYRGSKSKGQDGRKGNAQNLSQEDRARGGRHSAKNRGNQRQRHYGHDHDNEDYDDSQNYKGGNKPKSQDGRRNNGQNLTHEDRVRGGKNSRKSSGDYGDTQHFGTSKIKSPKSQDGRRFNAQNLSQEDRARGGRNSSRGQRSKNFADIDVGSGEVDELLEDAKLFMEQPLPDKVADNLHYEDNETEDFTSGSEIDEMFGGEPDPDQAEMDRPKKTYLSEYGGKNRNRGQRQGQDGRRNNAQNLSQEDRARGGRHSAKNRGSQKQRDYGNEDEDEEDDDDNQGRGKGQGGRSDNRHQLTQGERARGGRHSAKNRGGQKQRDYDNEDEDEDEDDYDDNQGRGKGQGGRSDNRHQLTQEERVRGGRHSAKNRGSQKQRDYDNEDEDEEDDDDNQGRGKGQGGRSDNRHQLTQEERARGGRHTAKNRGSQKQRDDDNEDEDEDDDDDNQGRGKGQGGRSDNRHQLTQEERARGGRHTAKNRGSQKQRNYDNEDEDEEDDDDDNQNRGKGQGGGSDSRHQLTQEERARGGRHSAKNRGGQKQRNYDNEDEDEDEEDYEESDDNQNRGKGQGGRRGNAQNLSHEDRVRGGKNSGKARRGQRQENYDEDEDEYPLQKKRHYQLGEVY